LINLLRWSFVEQDTLDRKKTTRQKQENPRDLHHGNQQLAPLYLSYPRLVKNNLSHDK
jgi:hypothetical protein